MPAQSRLPPTQNAATDTSTSTGTAGGGAGQSNSAIAQFVEAHGARLSEGRDVRFDVLTSGDNETVTAHASVDMEKIRALETQLVTVPAAHSSALQLAAKAAQHQRDDEIDLWEATLQEIESGPGAVLDTVTDAQHPMLIVERFFSDAAADPRYPEVKAAAESLEVTGRAATSQVAFALTPTAIFDQPVYGLGPERIDPHAQFNRVLFDTWDRLDPVLEAGTNVMRYADTFDHEGYYLQARVLEIAVGPLGIFPVGTPQFEYVWKAFKTQCYDERVTDALIDLMNIDDVRSAPASDIAESVDEAWGSGRPEIPMVDAGGAASGGPDAPAARDRDEAHADMAARQQGGTAETKALDTTEVDEAVVPAWGSDEEEEEKEEEEKKPDLTPSPTKLGAEGSLKTGDGTVTGTVTGTRSTNPGGTGSDTSVTLEGGATGTNAHGTVGLGYTDRTLDENGKSGMDVGVDTKFGVNKDGELIVQGGVGGTSTAEDGTKTSAKTTVGWNGKGVDVGQSVSTDTKLDNGNTQTNSASGTFNQATGEVSGTAGRTEKDADGNVVKSTDVSGGFDMDGSDGTQSANMAASHQTGAVKVSVNAGWKQSIDKPEELDDGRWKVTYSEEYTGGGSLGGEGKKVGASGGIQVGKTNSGTRIFKSEAEAQEFYLHGDTPGNADTAEDARNMQEGETRREGSSVQGNLSGNAKVGMFSVGGGVTFGNEDFTKTTKGKKGLLRMEVGGNVFAGWNASAGAGGVSLGYGESHIDSESKTVEFDLDTEVGRYAYDYYQETEKLPPSGRGWRLVGNMKGEADTKAKSLGLLGVAVGHSSTVSHTDRTEDGHDIEEDLGSEGASVSIPLLGSYSEQHSLYMQQIDDENALYHTDTTVKSDDIGDVRRGMSRGTGDYSGNTGKNRGTYHVQSVFTQKEMDTFVYWVVEGGRGGSGLAGLRRKLASADGDGQRRVLAQWVADEGDEALQVMFELTHGDKNTNFYVEIDGDEFMKGMKGHLDQENRIARWQNRLDGGEGGFAIVNEVRGDLAFMRRRRDALRTYGELPGRLLELEYTRTDQHLANLQLLLDRALATITEATPDSQLGVETFLFQSAMQVLRRSRAQYAKAHTSVKQHRRIHLDGYGRGLGFDDNAYEELTSETKKYDEANRLYKEGQVSEKSAQEWETRMNEAEFGPNNAGLLGSYAGRAAFEFQSAARTWDKASAIFSEVASRRSDSDGGLLDGYQYGYIDGQ